MKKILLAGVISFAMVGCVAPAAYQKVESLNEVSQVVEVNGHTQKQIFDASKIWMAKNFKSANDVIQYSDLSTGTIVGKGSMQYPCSGAMDCMANAKDLVTFTIKIDTKDNRARVSFNDLIWKKLPSASGGIVTPGGEYPLNMAQPRKVVETKLNSLIEQYKVDIVNQKSDSNW